MMVWFCEEHGHHVRDDRRCPICERDERLARDERARAVSAKEGGNDAGSGLIATPADLRALLDAATPEPWAFEVSDPIGREGWCIGQGRAVARCNVYDPDKGHDLHNAALIVALRNKADDLLRLWEAVSNLPIYADERHGHRLVIGGPHGEWCSPEITEVGAALTALRGEREGAKG